MAIHRVVCLSAFLFLLPAFASAQGSGSRDAGTATTQSDGTLRIKLPVLTVTAQKEPEDAQKAPVSVTAVPAETLESAGVRTVSDAADFAPNTFFNEFSARKLSNPRFRAIGSSPANPGITTYIDGVPQLHASSSSLELLDVSQIELVRGPQSALFGRNTIGGLVNISSLRPSLAKWSGSLVGPFGNFETGDVRFTASGPVVNGRVGLGIAAGYSTREGFTTNDVTGNDLDSRSASFVKTQLLWTPSANWETRFIFTGERARDGDYALNDLDALRANPFHASRDFEGFTDRDIVAPTFAIRRTGGPVDITATTGVVWWETRDQTDLDYTALPLARRDNREKDVQFTQDVRFASARNTSLSLSDGVTMRWQAGVSVFTQNFDQEAFNDYAPFLLDPRVGFPVRAQSPLASLDDRGVGAYGETTFTLGGTFDATVGLRGDFEHKQASLDTAYTPLIAPPNAVREEETFGDVSPQFTAAYRPSGEQTIYATAARGFKAGGFNAAAPLGSEAYGEEHSWNYEGGVKTLWFDERLSANASVFYTRWRDMQVNLPNVFVPGQFFIGTAAGATAKGVELELNARVAQGCDLFAGLGYTNATFDAGSFSFGVPVAGKRVSNMPNYTADIGGQYSVAITPKASLYARADFIFRGDTYYDDTNLQQQDAYSLANFRIGTRGRRVFGELWIRNAFDTHYIPLAFAYPGLAPSGFVGENGAPRMYGVRAGVSF